RNARLPCGPRGVIGGSLRGVGAAVPGGAVGRPLHLPGVSTSSGHAAAGMPLPADVLLAPAHRGVGCRLYSRHTRDDLESLSQPRRPSGFLAMSLLGPSLVLYVLVGIGVALALFLTDRPPSAGLRFLRVASALPFWPFYLPILLARAPAALVPSEDALERTVAVVQRELDAALTNLDGWIGIPEEARRRMDGLRAAWKAQTERIRE